MYPAYQASLVRPRLRHGKHSTTIQCPVSRSSHRAEEITMRTTDNVTTWNERTANPGKIGIPRLRIWGANDPSTSWPETLKDMPANHEQWQLCCHVLMI